MTSILFDTSTGFSLNECRHEKDARANSIAPPSAPATCSCRYNVAHVLSNLHPVNILQKRSNPDQWDMLARLSHHSARWIDLQLQHANLSKWEDENDLHIDLELVSPLVPINLSWYHVMALCKNSVLPAYRNLRNVLEKDIDHVSKLLSELDPLAEETEDRLRMEGRIPDEPQGSPSIEPTLTSQSRLSSDSVERRTRKRRRSSTPQERVVIHPIHPFAPTIIINPCPPQPRETSCWVPYQDASFGTRLMVPTYAALNSIHPPMIAPTDPVRMQIDDWEYTHGHWRAVIPPPDEQCRRGMFSRTALPRRRARRPPSRTNASFS